MVKLTRKKAKELSLLKWKYLSDHPKRTNIPEDIKEKVKALESWCGLCELFRCMGASLSCSCPGCPIDDSEQNCFKTGSWFDKYKWEKVGLEKNSKAIYDCIKAWKV